MAPGLGARGQGQESVFWDLVGPWRVYLLGTMECPNIDNWLDPAIGWTMIASTENDVEQEVLVTWEKDDDQQERQCMR